MTHNTSEKKHYHTCSLHKCHCNFIPPFVQENMARAETENIDDIILGIQDSKIQREKRESKVNDMAEFASLATTGQASRKIYDCQTQWNQHIDLVLEEGGPVNADQIINNAYDFAGKTRDYLRSFEQKIN